MRDKIRRLIQAALGLTQEALLRQLNPLLRGWANYYRNGAAKATFGKLDHYVWRKLWRWISRRHPNKSPAWKKRKYFSAAGDKRGVQRSDPSPQKGQSRVLTLYRMASTTIERHIKVRGTANPYDPRYTAILRPAPMLCLAHTSGPVRTTLTGAAVPA